MKKLLPGSLIFLLSLIIAASLPPSRAKQKIALGEMLFNEKMLSKDSSVSCASCHNPEFAFADTLPFSIGIGGKLTTRNTPSVLNMKNRPYYFWDGRAASLEEQALIPLQNPDEMGLPVAEAVKRLNESEVYRKLFRKVFRQDPNENNLAAAFAAYEQTLETVDSKFDDWSNNKIELTDSEERGRQLFVGSKAKCFECHSMEDFTDDDFKNIGLFDGKELNDAGRFLITGDSADVGKFKTPGLRNVAVTAPYMHNGMFQTLDQVLAYYNTPVHFVDKPINIDSSLIRPLGLTPAERNDIVAFLKTLTDRKQVKKATTKK
jgi:cytochrome c peroxidase